MSSKIQSSYGIHKRYMWPLSRQNQSCQFHFGWRSVFFFLIGMIHFISGAFQHVVSGLNYIYINLKLYKHNVVSKYISKILTFFGPRCGSDNFLT